MRVCLSEVVLDEPHVHVEEALDGRQVEPARLDVLARRGEDVDANAEDARPKVLRVRHDRKRKAGHPRHRLA